MGPILKCSRAYIDPAWQMRAVGDLPNDGRPEFIWQRNDGAVAYWRKDGSMRLRAEPLPALLKG